MASSVNSSSAWSVYKDSMEETSLVKNAMKLTSSATSLVKYFNPSSPESLSKIGNCAKQAKGFVGIFEIPIKIEKFVRSFFGFDTKSPVSSSLNVASDFCGVVSNSCEVIEFANTVSSLPKAVVENSKVASYGAGFFSSVKGSYDTVCKLAKNFLVLSKNSKSLKDKEISDLQGAAVTLKTHKQVISNLISLSTKVCAVALSVMGVVSLFTPVAPLALICTATAASLLGVSSFIYDRVYDPNDDRAKKIAQSPFFQKAQEIDAKKA
jgi:hypothetical protein